MELILLETVRNLGEIGDLVEVRNGYARNYLIPQKKAIRATQEAKAKAEEMRIQHAKERTRILEDSKARAGKAAKEVTIRRLSTETGHLYGSVTPADIAEAMSAIGTEIDKSEVEQSIGHIKELGDYEVEITLHPEVVFPVKVVVAGQEES